MTSQKDQIQALITDIDGVLQKTTPRLPWVVSGEMTQQRQVLERVRNYLVAFQRRQIAGDGFGQAGARPDLLAHDIYYQPAQPFPSPQQALPSEQPPYGQDDLNAQQMLQAIVQEMGYLRSNLMQPLQGDLEVLRQQREALVYEIRQLEAQRQGYTGQLPGQQQLITEFLQALMSRLQETLPQQVAQTLRSSNQQALSQANNLALAGSAPSVIATSDAPSQGLGNIQVSQSSSDELLIRLDSTLSIVFESLQRNVQAYQESLSQGLDKMHSMGQQGEMMFTALISHLAQQLGRETSSYLQSPVPANREAARSPNQTMGLPTSPPVPAQSSALSQPSAEAATSLPLSLPFPGTEIADQLVDTKAASTNVPAPSVDTAIDSWLRSAASTTPDVDLELAALNLEGFDLSQLAAQDVNALLELDATLLGTNLPSQPILSPTAPSDPPLAPANTSTAEDTADIDAALKLLEQLSSELQEPSSVADADAQIDRMLSSPTAPTADPSTVGIPDDARDELDEFYESLFGADAIGTPAQDVSTQSVPTAVETAPQPTAAPVNQAIVAPEAAIATSAEPSDQPTVQPISTLPAETQKSADALAEPTTPAASTVADPTLGWHLPTAPLVTPITEPDIPAALLEDELLDGWDLADDEVALAEPATSSTPDDLLGGWDVSPVGDDRASLPLDAPAYPATQDQRVVADESQAAFNADAAAPLVDAATSQPQTVSQNASSQEPASYDAISSLSDLFGDSAFDDHEVSQDASSQEPASYDAGSSLTDLFGDSAFGATDPTQPLTVDPAIGDAPAIPAPPAPTPTASPSIFASETSTTQRQATELASANLADGYLTDDRYAPAAPDEDLLPLDEPIEPLDSELWLDETTLNRLSEDLFNLEESIGEPATPYGSESDDSTQALFAETAFAETAFADAAATTEPTPTSEPTTLGDWSDGSLDDFAVNLDAFAANEVAPDDSAPDEAAAILPTTQAALFPLESESSAIAAEPPNTFMLEGMDDLFANTPVAPPVTPISPPVSSAATETPLSFALEGMDDLFTDSLASDQTSAPDSTPVIEPLFTLEGANEPFTEDPVVKPATLFPDPSPTTAPLFTLEGVDALFAADPVVSPLPLPSSAQPSTTDQPLPFTLEGVDELFADMPPMQDTPPILDVSPAILPVADSAATEAEATFLLDEASPASTQADPAVAFTLDQVDTLLVEPPTAPLPAQEALPTAAIAPNLDPLTEDAASPAPFALEQVGDLFIEIPSGDSTLNDQTASEQATPPTASLESSLTPFTLDPVGDLFVETPFEAAPAAQSETPLPTQPPTAPSEPSALEQAFASLMGSIDEPLDPLASLTDTMDTTTDTSEKKKEMS